MEKFRDKLPPRTRKVLVGFVGWVVLLAGIVMIPYPGPGWVVVFIGLSILATEFAWARSVHTYARGKYDAWGDWMSRQPGYVKAIFWVLTAATVIVTVWLLNGYGLIDTWLHLGLPWLHSPLPLFS